MEKQFFRFKKRDFIGIFTGVAGFALYKYSSLIKDLLITNTHPTREYAEMLIKLDNRITNFCGYNYKISGFKLIENSEKYQSYRMNLKGIRGVCKVLVKVQKVDNEELNFLNNQQKQIAKMPYEQRKKEPFIPIDFSDVFLPTEKTFQDFNERIENFKSLYKKSLELSEDEQRELNNLSLSVLPDDTAKGTGNSLLLQLQNPNHTNHFGSNSNMTNNEYQMLEKLNNKLIATTDNSKNESLLNEFNNAIKIRENDSFYRFMNISVSYSENAIFNIRPLNIKYRDYEFIDTEYSDFSYLDIFKKINKIKSQFDYKMNYELSAEELKNELKASKQNYFKEKLEYRAVFIKYQLVLMIGIVFAYKYWFKMVNYHRIYAGVVENLSKNKVLKDKLGTNVCIPYVAFRYNLFSKNYTFNTVAQIGDNKIIVKGKSLPNADNVFPTLNFYDKNQNSLKI